MNKHVIIVVVIAILVLFVTTCIAEMSDKVKRQINEATIEQNIKLVEMGMKTNSIPYTNLPPTNVTATITNKVNNFNEVISAREKIVKARLMKTKLTETNNPIYWLSGSDCDILIKRLEKQKDDIDERYKNRFSVKDTNNQIKAKKSIDDNIKEIELIKIDVILGKKIKRSNYFIGKRSS